MKIKKLTMQAFGPFKDKVVIDFEKENIDSGLLLITGDTGAGKTTIFDAICFSLYGEASGVDRKANNLRSDFASSNVETFVELEFYYENKLYIVRRSPEYERESKRGSGLVKKPAEAFFEINNRIITKTSDVTKEIINLIGLDYKQFHQIAMLSQGEFTRFLLADAKEKNNIFRKIFDTNIYNNISLKLSSDLSKKEDEYKLINNNLNNELNKLDSSFKENLSIIKVIDKLKIKLVEDKISLEDMKIKLNDLNKKIKDNEIILNKITDTNNKIDELNNSKIKLKNLLKENEDINSDKDRYEYNITSGMKIKECLRDISKYEELIKKDKLNLEKEEKNYNILLNENKNSINKYKVLDTYSIDMSKIIDKINLLKNDIAGYNNYIKLNSKLEKDRLSLKEIISKFELQSKIYDDIKIKYYLNEASILADTLEDGKMCPVCGSISHPKKAVNSNFNISKDDLLEEEAKYKDILVNREKIESQIDNLNDDMKDIIKYKDIDINLLNRNLNKLEIEKENMEKEYNHLLKLKNSLNNKISRSETSISLFENNIKLFKDKIDNLLVSLNRIYAEYNTSLNEYNLLILDNNSLKNLKIKIDNFDKVYHTLNTKIEMLNSYDNKEKEDTNKCKNDLLVLNSSYDDLNNTYTKNYSLYERNKEIYENIIKYNNEFESITKKYLLIKNLSDTANGKIVGMQRITFENYVQSYYMDSILNEANKRLIKMTDGRFMLRNKTEATSLLNRGLDFSVIDYYTGKVRDVTSLSGGEKFKASLSLALGLSDVISSFAGGIKMDVLFVDEGFGSLDNESINQALNTLSSLATDSKLVAIISHVEELNNMIDNKIIVNKGLTGSNIKIEN